MKQRFLKMLCLLTVFSLAIASLPAIAADVETVNVALNKTAIASDWEDNFLPEYACDGINDNAQYTAWKSTGSEKAPWIVVDMNLGYKLYSIVIQAKKGETSAQERGNFEVYGAQNEDFSDAELLVDMKNRSIDKNGEISQIVKSASVFRYIKIQKKTFEPLSVGEIQVFAKKSDLASAVAQNSNLVRQPYFGDDRKFIRYEDADEFDDNGETALLSVLGIMQGFEDGNFYPYETVSKAEFVAYVMRMSYALKMTDAPTAKAGTTFSDVPLDHWANPYVEKAYQMGIAAGDGAGSFLPDKRVTYNEAAKMLIAALGYQNLAIAYGGYPGGYFRLANELGFQRNMAYYGDEITHIDTAIMIYNAMRSDYIKIDYTLTEGVLDVKNISVTKNGLMFMTEVAGITEAIGVMDGAENTSLTQVEPALGKEKLSVDKTVYRSEFPNAKKLIGYRVKYWYQEDNEETTDFLLTAVSLSSNKTAQFIKEDFIKAQNNRVSYYNEFDKEVTLNYRRDVDVVYNGRAYLQYDPDKLFDTFTSVLLIDNNGDSVYDCIIMVREQTGIISFVNLYDEAIYFKNGLPMLSYNETTIFTASWDDSVLSAEQLMENDVLTIVSSRNDADGIDCVIVTRDAIYGSVSMVTTEGDIKIKNKEYKISPAYSNADIGIGDTGYFYLDYHGEICYADIKDFYGGNYGYLVGVSSVSGLDGFKIRIYTSAGTMKDYAPYKTMLIDGVSYQENEYARITDRLRSTAEKVVYGQPIRYVVKNNTLRLIDTPAKNAQDETDIMRVAINNETVYYSSSRIFDARYPVSDDVVVMRIPNDVTQYEKYTMESVSKYRDGYPYTFSSFTDNDDDEIKLILSYGEFVLDRDSGLAVISDVFTCVDANNDIKQAIKAFYNGALNTYIEDDAGIISAAGVAAGDIVALSVDSENVLYGIEKRFYQGSIPQGASGYAISTDTPVQGVSGEAFSVYQDYFMAYATVAKRNHNNILIKITDSSGNPVTTAKNNGEVLFNATGKNIMVYDSTAVSAASRVRKGDVNDLIDEHSGTPSKIVLKARNGNISFICVMK